MTGIVAIVTGVALSHAGILAEQTKKTPVGGVAEDNFGVRVAMDGDTAVVGSQAFDPGGVMNAGAAYVFTRSGGTWTQVAILTASDGMADDNFGFSVAIDGETIVVGASYGDIGAGMDQGAAYVFEMPPGGWTDMTETAKLRANPAGADDLFGYSVAIEGDTIAVSAPNDDIGGNADQGAIYVFERPAGGWVNASQTARLTVSDADIEDILGASVGISGDTIVAGAPNADNTGPGVTDGTGAAYLFVRPAGGWVNGTETAKLTASDGSAYDLMGYGVAIDGGVVVSGAVNDGHSGGGVQDGSGSAYVFEMPEGGWQDATQDAKLIYSNPEPVAFFGFSAAVRGELVLIGSVNRFHTPAMQDGQGAAYVFERPAGGWSGVLAETLELTAADALQDRFFGYSIAIEADWLLIGSPLSGPGNAEPGGVYFFARDNDEDGVGNHADNCPDDSTKLDPGVCGCGVAEVDTDGDGAFDCVDACPDDDTDDSDGDGVCDSADVCAEGDDTVDVDGNGTPDACDAAAGLPVGGDCCGGGMPAMLPLMLLGAKRRRARMIRR